MVLLQVFSGLLGVEMFNGICWLPVTVSYTVFEGLCGVSKNRSYSLGRALVRYIQAIGLSSRFPPIASYSPNLQGVKSFQYIISGLPS